MRELITHDLNEPEKVSDDELRCIVMQLLEHLKLNAFRYTDGTKVSYIALEKAP